MIGESLGPYKILELLGAGGMGEVYLGEDTRLGRKVAIKVLPGEFASDPERLARFEQEARAAAALNHPHIAVVHDVGSETGEDGTVTHFMVQEYLEGQSLRERLGKGALPVDNALRLAAEIGEALAAAHKGGIIHRDLKPDNIFVTEEGHAKILDFGLAKLTETAAPAGGQASMSPTILGTVAGQVMGTAGYMAPEQAAGAAEIDHRADLFAFGCVLYEMTTGAQPFAGRSVADTLAKIQHEGPPPLADRDPSAPTELQRIIGKCLAKQRGRRYQHADDLIVDLRTLQADVEAGTAAPLAGVTAGASPPTARLKPLPLVVAALLGVLVSAIVFSSLRTSPPGEVTRLSLEIDDGRRLASVVGSESFQRPGFPAFALSPAGRHLVYSATDGDVPQLYLRALDQRRATAIPGTEGASFPFFSPDGLWIGFFDGLGLKRAPVGGGSVELIAELQSPSGFASWTDEDTIVFLVDAAPHGLFQVAASGGTPVRITTVDRDLGEVRHLFPQMLPGGGALLFTVMDALEVPSGYDIVVQNLQTGDRSLLIEGGSDARYLTSGHIVFMRGGNLMAVAFDIETLAATTEPVVVIEDVMHSERGSNSYLRLGVGQYSVSSSGTLAYATGGIFPESVSVLDFVDVDGVHERLSVPAARHLWPRVSPDGTRVAYGRGSSGELQIWVYDVASRTPRPLTFEGTNTYPVWSPDGTRIAFRSEEGPEAPGLFWMAADGAEEPRRITSQGVQADYPASWSPDGVLVYLSDRDIMFVEVDGGGEPEVFLQTPFIETHPALSPNGRWLAYASDEAGVVEVWVRAFPEGVPAYRISTAGGTAPVWSRDGRRLFYEHQGEPGREIWVVDVTTESGFSRDTEPRPLLEESYRTTPIRSYDVAPDGRFLLPARADEQADNQPVTSIKVVLNWFQELKQRVPTGR